MRAIRIIREPSEVQTSVEIVEREEQLRLVALHLAEALREATPDRMAGCVEKLKGLYRDREIDEVDDIQLTASEINHVLLMSDDPIGVHADIDISRILELLED